jgi:CheY-like chemotaxis protein
MTMIPRQHHPETDGSCGSTHRLNLLLSTPCWNVALDSERGHSVEQLPHLLAPMGIQVIRANSGEEAADVIRQFVVHIAVVDLSVPLQRATHGIAMEATAASGGPRVLQLLRRLDQPPPTVVIRPPQPAVRESARSLCEALREGAFAVLDQPVHLESMLEVMRRIVRRHYADCWPA